MNNIHLRKLLPVLIFLLLTSGSCSIHLFHKNPERALFGKTHRSKKEAKVKEPRKVLRAKSKQEANERRLDRNYDKSIKRSQKRTIDIQTPEVQERMKQNKKDYKIRDKGKRKKTEASTKKAGQKYR
jgi:hypothetical protein